VGGESVVGEGRKCTSESEIRRDASATANVNGKLDAENAYTDLFIEDVGLGAPGFAQDCL
jgi:hypothetical protein